MNTKNYQMLKEKNIELKYDSTNLFIKTYNYDLWFENEEPTDKKQSTSRKEFVDLSYMPPLEGDEEEVKERKILKIFDPKQIIS